MSKDELQNLVIGIKGAGEMASGVAWCLYAANLRKIFMMEIASPLAVRRNVSFCEALHKGTQTVEGVEAVKVDGPEEIKQAWAESKIAVFEDSKWRAIKKLNPDVVVDAILAKKNLGTSIDEAGLVIGLGPGFTAGHDVHAVIETKRGHDLARIIESGSAAPNTGVPGTIGGEHKKRVLRAPVDGRFRCDRRIGDAVGIDEIVGYVGDIPVRAKVNGLLRGLIRTDTEVTSGLKLGDVDPRAISEYCITISEKARAIGGAVLQAILRVRNQ